MVSHPEQFFYTFLSQTNNFTAYVYQKTTFFTNDTYNVNYHNIILKEFCIQFFLNICLFYHLSEYQNCFCHNGLKKVVGYIIFKRQKLIPALNYVL